MCFVWGNIQGSYRNAGFMSSAFRRQWTVATISGMRCRLALQRLPFSYLELLLNPTLDRDDLWSVGLLPSALVGREP